MEETKTTAPAPKKGGVNPIIIAVVILLVVGGLGYMMYNSNKGSEAVNTTEQPTEAMQMNEGNATAAPSQAPQTTGTESAMTGESMSDIKTVDIEAGSFYYKPNVITVKKGQKVKIVMKSVSMMHDFNIDELNVKMPIVKNGDTGTVEFTADQVGKFEYYCSVGNHRAQGQVGTLTVTE